MATKIVYKTGTSDPTKLHPDLKAALKAVQEVWSKYGLPEAVVTSLNDGKHRTGSWHYKDRAFDLRCHYPSLDGRELQVVRDLKTAISNPLVRVIVEDVGEPNEHIHVERP